MEPEILARVNDSERANEIEAELSTIYLDDNTDGGLEPDMTKLEQAKHSTLKKVLMGFVVFSIVLGGITAMGYYYFGQKNDEFTGEQVMLTIEGPDEAKSGEAVNYTFKYHNTSDTPLGTASLELRLPSGFAVRSSDPAPMDNNTWKIGSMPPWGRGQVRVSGVMISPLEKEHDIQAIVTYRPANFNAEFQKVATKTTKISGTLFGIEIDAIEKALPGDTVEVTIDYRNESELPLENATLRADFPAEFIPESANPGAASDTFREWWLDTIEAFASGTVKVTGTFASEAYGHVTLPVAFGYTDKNDFFVEQAKTSHATEVLQGQLVAALVMNGKSDNQAVSLGDTLHYSVSYRNTGEASLGNVEVAVVVEAVPKNGLLMWNDLFDENEGALDGNRISWTSRQIESLSRLEAGDEGAVDFTVPISMTPPLNAESSEWLINSWVETFVESIDGDVVNRSTKSQPIEAKILSDAELDVSARFYDETGLALGSGVIPPEVGRETTYRMFWNLSNSLHELSDLKIKARLPNNVEWNGKSEVGAGDLRYDSAQREMIWTLNWMPKTVDEIGIWFDVTITPTEEQKDRIPTLVDATVFEATDITAESPILISGAPITTSLKDDPRALGKGRVR